jgi:hypothetical protein
MVKECNLACNSPAAMKAPRLLSYESTATRIAGAVRVAIIKLLMDLQMIDYHLPIRL